MKGKECLSYTRKNCIQQLIGCHMCLPPKAMDRDPDYIDFVQRMDNAPEETLFSSTENGLANLKEGPNVIHALEGRLKGVIVI